MTMLIALLYTCNGGDKTAITRALNRLVKSQFVYEPYSGKV